MGGAPGNFLKGGAPAIFLKDFEHSVEVSLENSTSIAGSIVVQPDLVYDLRKQWHWHTAAVVKEQK